MPTSAIFFTQSISSAAVLHAGSLQNAQRSIFPLPRDSSIITQTQPSQIILPQQNWKAVWSGSNGNIRKQIGHSSPRGGCSLNSSSSCNSATRLSHAFLCFDWCFFLHAALQYLTILHLLHVFRLPPSLPHDAQLKFAVEVMLTDDIWYLVHVVFGWCINYYYLLFLVD